MEHAGIQILKSLNGLVVSLKAMNIEVMILNAFDVIYIYA
jgi:hypothetical protein